MAYIEEIREMGDGSVRDGVLTGIEEGYFHREIQEASYEYQQRVDRGEEVVVGVNRYRTEGDPDTEILKVDDGVSQKQLDRLERVKRERDDEAVAETLDALSSAIDEGENVMPYVIDAVKAYATMGEVMSVFETHYGKYSEKIGLV